MKRGNTGISALIAVDKPAGMTSHDVVNRVRRLTGEGRVGHAGTLDPAATGLMLVGIGPATRLLPYLTGHDKSYIARIVFGAETNTDDAEGEVTATAPIPEELSEPFVVADFVAGLAGKLEQVPPAFSAIKKDGVRSYAAARKGEDVELEPRSVEVYEAQLLGVDYDPYGADGLSWDVAFAVSKGTYIRALARDIGRALGTCAHLGDLRRTASGQVTLAQAYTLEDLEGCVRNESDGVAFDPQFCVDPAVALGFAQVNIDEADIIPLNQGRQLQAPQGTPEGLVSLVCQGKLLSVHECREGRLIAQTVIPGGVAGVR